MNVNESRRLLQGFFMSKGKSSSLASIAMAPAFSMAMVSRPLPNNRFSRLFSFETFYRYSTAADTSQPEPHFLLEYLISSLGFSKEEATITTTRLRSTRYFRRDPNLVVNFLLNLGLRKIQIKSMVSVDPRILSYNVDKTLAPKIQVLQDIGISGSDLVKVFMNYKAILAKSKPPVDSLRNLIGNDELVAELIKKRSKVLDSKVPKIIEVLIKNGFSIKNVVRILIRIPPGIYRNPEFYQGVIDRVENDFGISRQSKMFYHGVLVLSSISDSRLAMKFELYRSFGLSDATIYRMVGKFPYMLLGLEDKIRKSWNFFIKELGYPPEYILARPCIVKFDFERRVKPRTEVLKILKEKKLTRKLALYNALIISDLKFVNGYLLPYKDKIPEVYDSYLKIIRRKEAEIR